MVRNFTALAVFFPVALAGCQVKYSPTAVPVDGPEAVARMEASLDMANHGISVEPFEIDRADYGRVLALFRDGTALPPFPVTAWMVAGRVVIFYRDGRECVVWLFRTFGGPGAYKVYVDGAGGTHYRGSTDEAIIRTIQECHGRARAARGDG